MSALFRLNGNQIVQGAINAVLAAIVVGLYGIVTTPDFNLFTADWSEIGKSVLNWAFAAFVGSAGKAFLTDKEGTVNLGVAKIKKA